VTRQNSKVPEIDEPKHRSSPFQIQTTPKPNYDFRRVRTPSNYVPY